MYIVSIAKIVETSEIEFYSINLKKWWNKMEYVYRHCFMDNLWFFQMRIEFIWIQLLIANLDKDNDIKIR